MIKRFNIVLKVKFIKMKGKSCYLGLLLIVSSLCAFGSPSDVTIKYIIKKDGMAAKHTFSTNILGIVENNWDHIDQTSKKELRSAKEVMHEDDTTAIILVKYQLSRGAGCYFLLEGLGHELLLSPSKDTITVTMRPIFTRKMIGTRNSYVINDSIISSWSWRLTFPEKYKYVGFFDSIAYLHGDMRANMQMTFKTFDHNLSQYLNYINTVYKDRIIFCREFARQFYFPEQLKYYAKKEIQYSYYYDLMEPVVRDDKLLNTYPKELIDTFISIKKYINNPLLFKKISAYRITIYSYVNYIGTNPFINKQYHGNYYQNRLQYSKTYLDGERQGYILARFMEQASQNNEKESFITLYNNYNRKSSSEGITTLVDSLYEITVMQHPFSNDEILNFTFLDSLHKKVTLKGAIAKKIIFIDCWATWCIPCIAQIPFIDSLAEAYKDQVQFISIAADQFIGKWDSWIIKNSQEKKNITPLYSPGGFDNIFFKKIRISSIPRYILLSDKGEILNISMPRPNDRKAVETILNKYIKSSGA